MKLPSKTTKAIIMDLAVGMTKAEVSRKYQVNHNTITQVSQRYTGEIEERKKAALEASKAKDGQQMAKIADEFAEIAKLAQAQIKLKLPQASAAQAAIIAGIATDKRHAILGQPTGTMLVKFELRNDMIAFIRGSKSDDPKPPDEKPL